MKIEAVSVPDGLNQTWTMEKYFESISFVKVLTKSDWVYREWPASACLAAQPTAQAHLHALALVPCCARANPSSMPAKKKLGFFFFLLIFFFFYFSLQH